MRHTALFGKCSPLCHAEAVLFIRDDQPEPCVFNGFLKDGMCPDNDLRRAICNFAGATLLADTPADVVKLLCRE